MLPLSVFQGSEKIVEVAVEAMEVDDTLWIHYFDDFARDKLHLPNDIAPLTRQILQVYIGVNALDCKDMLSKLVSLHVRLHVHQLDIAKVVRVLRPMLELEREGSSLKPDPTATLTLESVVSPKHTAGQKRLPNISSFIVIMLFETFCEAALRSSVKLTQCCKSYLGIVCSLFALILCIRVFQLRCILLMLCIHTLSTDVYTFHGRGYSGWSHSRK